MNSFTTNYNLDLYDPDDKPNLNDQYNDAMGKIDVELAKQAGDIVTAETAVANLSTKVEGYDGRITANTTAIATNTGDIATLKTDVATAQTAAETAQTTAENAVSAAHDANDLAVQASSAAQTAQTTANAAQASATKAMERKYLVTLGDSWVDRANGDFTVPLANLLGYQLQNVAVSGSGFTTTNNILSQVSNITAPADSIDMVLILGGVNDVKAGATSVASYIVSLAAAIKAKAPKAKIIVIGSQNVPSVNPSLTYNFTSALGAACQQTGIGFISMFGWFIGMTGIWDTAQIHLTNSASTTILVSKIVSYIYGDGSSDVRTSTLTLNSGVTGITITGQSVYCMDDHAIISLDLTISEAKGSQTIMCPTPYGGKESYGLVIAKSSASNVTYCYVGSSGALVLGEVNPAGAGAFKLFLTIPFI